MKTPRWFVVLFVLGVLCALAAERLAYAYERLSTLPRSLRILLAWIVASVLLVTSLAYAYRIGFHRGIGYGVERTLFELHPTRAALDGARVFRSRGAALDARRVSRSRLYEVQL